MAMLASVLETRIQSGTAISACRTHFRLKCATEAEAARPTPETALTP